MSSAGSNSTQWPSAQSSIASSHGDDLSNLQGILDRALIDPSSNQAEDTQQIISDNNIKINCKQAAHKIKDADILLVVTGAGFSADSGLATYIDVADVEAYNRKGWTYRDLCQPPSFIDNNVKQQYNHENGVYEEEVENDTKEESDILEINNLHDEALSIDADLLQQDYDNKVKGDIRDPKYFYGFWGQCVNDYRRVKPHEGYDIIAQWRESKSATTIAQEIRDITQNLEQYDSDDEVCDEKEEPYYVSSKRAGGFFLFTSNVDAHSYDMFESQEIRECHGNVELWQCHNFACGTNATNMSYGGSLDGFENDDDSEVEMNKKPSQQQQQWQRRLWRLPLDHHFAVDSNMAASEARVNEEATSSIPTIPASKRRKSTTTKNDYDNDNITDDTATALAGIMEDTLRNHLENEGTDNTDINENSPAHVGDVHGKPRLFPLKHMNHPKNNTQLQDHFLPIASDENWPKCPRCNEGARPAVLMFNDLDWVYNRSQEERWQVWCGSLLKLCKRRSRGLGADDDDNSMSTTSEANMSDSGWNDVSEPGIDSKPSAADAEDKVDEASKVSSDQQNSISSPQSSQLQSSGPPLRVAILEVGCGYNVPTCRVVAESLISELLMRGGDATLIRINPSHPEPDDDDIEDNIISIAEKGLAALKLIDEYYKELIEAVDQMENE